MHPLEAFADSRPCGLIILPGDDAKKKKERLAAVERKITALCEFSGATGTEVFAGLVAERAGLLHELQEIGNSTGSTS